MKIGRLLLNRAINIVNIRRIGKSQIGIDFKIWSEANAFVESFENFPENWIAYVTNFKILRSGIIRGVDIDLLLDEIREGITWPNNLIKIKSISRLKFKDKDKNILKDFVDHSINLLLHI